MSAPALNDPWPQLRSLGFELTPDQISATIALMAPHACRPGPDVEVHRDVAYGPDPRHRLDVFVPAAGTPIDRSRMDVAGNNRSLAEERWAGTPIDRSRMDIAGNNRSLAEERWAGTPIESSRMDVAGNNRSLAEERWAGTPIDRSRMDVAGNNRSLAEERWAGTPIESSRMDVAGNNRSLAEERWAGADRAPVLLFVHGGGFVMGDKGAPDAPFYNNIGLWAARSGCIGVTMTYRLAPAAPWPAGSEDVGAAVQFLHAAVERWGGDPKSVFLMGQSAGAVHVAGYVADSRLHVVPQSGIAGAIMISGLFDVARADRNPFQAAYYGEDPMRWPEQSTLQRLAETSLPCFYSVSEFDPPDFQRQAAWLVEAYAARQGRWPRLVQLTGHNHLSSVLQIGSSMDTLGPELLRFVHRA